jgi:probable HAF family extracellular repeat protein
LWSGGSPIDLGTLNGPSPNSEALDINDGGEIVGVSSTSDEVTHAFYRGAGGALVDLGTLPGGWSSRANAINDAGVIVGTSDVDANSLEAGIKHAVIWTEPGTLFDLNDLVFAPGWILLEATDIDDQGNIVGAGVDPNGDRHGFLLIPQNPTAVLLAEFEASVGAREVAVHWALGSEAGIVAVHVYREAHHASGEVRLSERPIVVSADGRGSFLDQSVEPNRFYRYRLGLLDAEGHESMSRSLDVQTAARPRVAMEPPHPNPARAEFDVRVELEEAGPARLSLFDTAGRLRRVLFDGQLEAGTQVVSWSNPSSFSERLESGIYIAVLEAGGSTISHRVMILR